MKKFICLSLVILSLAGNGVSQTVQGTLLPGSSSNRVIFAIQASAPFSAPFTNVQFVLQIPNSVLPIPSVSIVNNFLAANIPSYNNSSVSNGTAIAFSNEGGYYNYLFSSVVLGGASYNFTNSTSNVLEIQISGGPASTATVRFASLANGGSSGQHYFYIEASGIDRTNEANMFFNSGGGPPVNGGSYSSYSHVPLPNVTLPVQFTGFNIQCNDKGALLTWGTASEQNTDRFEIQKSVNNTDWTIIGNVAAAGNSTTQKDYQYLDLNGGVAFYRIRQVDRDGRFVYTAIKRTDCKITQYDVILYPVPANDKLNVVIRSDKAASTSLQVVDISGKIVQSTLAIINQGTSNIIINVSSLPAGQYILVSSNPDLKIDKKFTIMR